MIRILLDVLDHLCYTFAGNFSNWEVLPEKALNVDEEIHPLVTAILMWRRDTNSFRDLPIWLCVHRCTGRSGL